ncbi:MAG: hypothetical protein JW914_05905 [Syntrophaceae bacterium]|nr:hypothetical protein [Syntrophaceae bacterium]
MKKVFIAVLLCLVFSFNSFAEQLPTEESLIAVWEEIQKNDPNNIMFEEIKDKEYKINNKKIPFEGILKIKDVIVDETMPIGQNDYVMGTVDVELVGVSQEFINKNARRYYNWARNNNLYYDIGAKKWINMQEFQKLLTEKQDKMFGIFSFVSNYFYIMLLIILIVFLVYFSRKQKKIIIKSLDQQAQAMTRMKKALELSEKSVELNQETNEILKDILDELKKSK